MAWGDRYLAEDGDVPMELRHRDCGELVHLSLVCDAGHELSGARDVLPVPRVLTTGVTGETRAPLSSIASGRGRAVRRPGPHGHGAGRTPADVVAARPARRGPRDRLTSTSAWLPRWCFVRVGARGSSRSIRCRGRCGTPPPETGPPACG
jgi:hypothetical protein